MELNPAISGQRLLMTVEEFSHEGYPTIAPTPTYVAFGGVPGSFIGSPHHFCSERTQGSFLLLQFRQ
jgi:hypothetical protein